MPACPVPGCTTVIHESSPFCLTHLARLDSATQLTLARAPPGTEPYQTAMRIALALLHVPAQGALIDYSMVELARCLDREIAYRVAVFPRRVDAGRMKQPEADRELAMMRQIRQKGFTPP